MSKDIALVSEDTPSHYVGIGASAGGLEAIELFFKNMPTDLGVAFIIVQHLSPDYKSLMTELLSKRTAMDVHLAEDGIEALANNVYLIPPSKNMTIFHGKLLLSEQDRSGGINLPIDIFFKSLAEDQGVKAIAVELSGTGSDGARGVRAIKEADGMVMVQSEDSAKFDGMPRSVIAMGLADFILSPEEMPKQLAAFVKHPYVKRKESSDSPISDDDGLTRIYSMLREYSRIDFTFYKPATVLRRIERRMTINQIHDLNDYVRYMENNRPEVGILQRELLIGVTNFFRDPEAFELISKKYLPEIIKKVEKREVRLWVAGCSTGEEAYTMAILCCEAMEEIGIAREVKIFATDVDHNAIEKAGMGAFTESIVTDVPIRLLSKYFVHHDDTYKISRRIREMVVFAQHNLIKDPPFTNVDFISCRNLLIYLQPVLQRKALELFNFSLNASGVMFLGSSETIGEMSEYFETLHNKWRIYSSKGKRKAAGLDLEPSRYDHSRVIRNRLAGTQAAARIHYEEEKILDRFLQTFADDYVQFAMVLNGNMEIIHAVGDTHNFLHVSPGLMSTDASKLVPKELSIPLSTGVQKVLKKREGLTFSKIRVFMGDKGVAMQMRIKPLPEKKGQDPLVGIFINEMQSFAAQGAPASEGVTFDVSKEAEDRIVDLEQELQFTRENLQATVEELETSNEELQATNEELLASNEELQSTNEELQSVNEELYTVNAEYQSKITELTEVNNDMDNLLASTNIGTLFLDEDMEIRRFSSKVTELMNIIDSDVGRPIDHISHQILDVDLSAISTEVLKTGAMSENEFTTKNGKSYLLRSFPYRIASNVFAGVVLIFIDITERKSAEIELEEKQIRFDLAERAAEMGTWEWGIEKDTFYCSNNLPSIFGLNQDSLIKNYKGFLDIVYGEDRDTVDSAIKSTIQKKKDRHFQLDHRIRMDDGTMLWMQETGEVHYDESGGPVRIIGTSQNITKRKLAEIELTNLSSTKPSVLIVDDDPSVKKLLKGHIASFSESINIISASNGYEGLIMAGRHKPVLIISDLLMPGMDGFQMVAAKGKDPLLKDIPLIIVSALSEKEINKHGGVPEGVHLLLKPIDYEMAEKTLHLALKNAMKVCVTEA